MLLQPELPATYTPNPKPFPHLHTLLTYIHVYMHTVSYFVSLSAPFYSPPSPLGRSTPEPKTPNGALKGTPPRFEGALQRGPDLQLQLSEPETLQPFSFLAGKGKKPAGTPQKKNRPRPFLGGPWAIQFKLLLGGL